MKTRRSSGSGADALVLAAVGLSTAVAAATLIHATVGLTRFALFLAVG
jgi:hypothetical protein